MSAPSLSVVIPAFNEDSRIRPTLDALLSYLRSRDRSFEILVVDDGSRDQTVAVAKEAHAPELRIIALGANRGKGAAVRKGIAESSGELVLVTDADLAIPIEELARFERLVEDGYSVVCGSRGLPDSLALSRLPPYRKRMGKLFNWMVRTLQLTELRDTQCGFKLFEGHAAREVFSRCTINRFAYDVEALRIAERLDYRIAEVSISWRHIPESRVHPFYDAVRMFIDLIRIRIQEWAPRETDRDVKR